MKERKQRFTHNILLTLQTFGKTGGVISSLDIIGVMPS